MGIFRDLFLQRCNFSSQASDVPQSKQKEFVAELQKSMEAMAKKRMANPNMKVWTGTVKNQNTDF